MSNQDQNLVNAFADLRRLRDPATLLPEELCSIVDSLDATLAQLETINEELTEKNIELAVLHGKFRELFDLAPDAFFVTNNEGIILQANPAAAELVAKDLNYVIGMPLRNFVASSHQRQFLNLLAQLGQDTEARTWEAPIASRDGTDRSVTCRVVSSPARGDQPVLHYWLIHDISERVQMERKMAELNADLERRVRERTSQLAQAHSDLRYLTAKLISIQEEERRRISRELHDEAGQGLIALRMNLEALRDDLPPEQKEIRERLIQAGELAYSTVESLRIMAQDLRPPAIEIVDFEAVLLQLCHEITRRTKLPIEFSGAPIPPLDISVRISLYRFLQEALSNTVRHAQATHVQVTTATEEGQVVMSVQDDGIGFDVAELFSRKNHSGIGLLGMKERLELIGGKLQVESVPDQGTRLAAVVPISQ